MPAWIMILLRSIFMFFIVLILLRVMGKKQPSRMNAFTFINYLVIGVIVSLISLNIVTNLAWGLIGLAVWSLLPIALDYLALKSKTIYEIIHGKETILIKQGKVMEENLFRARLTGEELLRELRSKNLFNLNEVEFAVMETTGDINVLPKSDYQPVTPGDLDRKAAPKTEPQTVILDGNILDEPLAGMGLNRAWLELQLENLGVSLTNVFIGQVASTGDLYLDLFDDSIMLPQPKVKELLYANLQKIQADLMIFALETRDQQVKKIYSANSAKLHEMLKKIKPYLLR